jgi:hypothetical protein
MKANMKSKTSWTLLVPLLFPFSLAAQTPSTSPVETSKRPIPFHGMVSAVDQTKKTFTISGKEATRVFKVTERTKILKGAATASMKDVIENEEVSGAYWKNPDGTLEAKMVKLGPMEKKTSSPTPKPSATPKS